MFHLERKKHSGLYKQEHSLEHLWSNFLAFHSMSKGKLHPVLQNSLSGNCGLDGSNWKKSRNDDQKCRRWSAMKMEEKLIGKEYWDRT